MSQTQAAVPLVLTAEDRAELVSWSQGRPPWLAERTRIVLAYEWVGLSQRLQEALTVEQFR
jgi:uncharacterized protein YbjT (DUF2867 family)